MASRPNRAFATALSAAMDMRGVSARRLGQELYRRGHTVPMGWIANWRNGRSLPRRASIQQAVREMEKILRLREDDLLAPLRSDLLAETAAENGRILTPLNAQPENDDRDIIRKFSSMDQDIDWDGEVYREAMEEEFHVSKDFHSVQMKISLVVRYGANPNPTLHVSAFWDTENTPPEEDIGVYEIDGAEVGPTRTEVYPYGISKTTTLFLPSGSEGDLRQIRYDQGYYSQEPLEVAVLRAFSWPISVYTGRVAFEGQVPPNIRWEQSHVDSSGTEKRVRERHLEPSGNFVQMSVENIANATGAFWWDLPEGIE